MKGDLDDAAYVMFRHVPLTGSTATGLSEAFASFWYFGALEFLLIGLFMGRWYRAAVAGNIAAQVSVILLMTAALESITHSTEVFLSDVLVLGLFLLPVLLIARGDAADTADVRDDTGRVKVGQAHKMRVLNIIQCTNLGGMEQSNLLRLKGLIARGHEVEVISLTPTGGAGAATARGRHSGSWPRLQRLPRVAFPAGRCVSIRRAQSRRHSHDRHNLRRHAFA